jgi:hypothetical protein
METMVKMATVVDVVVYDQPRGGYEQHHNYGQCGGSDSHNQNQKNNGGNRNYQGNRQ